VVIGRRRSGWGTTLQPAQGKCDPVRGSGMRAGARLTVALPLRGEVPAVSSRLPALLPLSSQLRVLPVPPAGAFPLPCEAMPAGDEALANYR